MNTATHNETSMNYVFEKRTNQPTNYSTDGFDVVKTTKQGLLFQPYHRRRSGGAGREIPNFMMSRGRKVRDGGKSIYEIVPKEHMAKSTASVENWNGAGTYGNSESTVQKFVYIWLQMLGVRIWYGKEGWANH